MVPSPPASRWTQLLAAAVAHDVGNLAHGLLNAPGSVVEGCCQGLRRISVRLRVLAAAGDGEAWARLDDACADACAEVHQARNQVLVAGPIPADLRAQGTAAALRTAIASLLEHAAAASPAGSPIRLALRQEQQEQQEQAEASGAAGGPGAPAAGRWAVVEISAPAASGRGEIGVAPLDTLLDTTLRDLRGDLSLVLAGAIASALGGAVHVASSAGTGLVLALRLAAAPPTTS